MLKRAYSASSSCSTPTTSSSEEADPSSLIPSTGEHGPDSMSQFSSRPDDQQSNDTMSDQEKAEKKREYNRLAQREFRKRRKEHMRSLETSQKEKQTQQTHEMERLRAELARMQQSYGHYESTLPLQNPYDTQSVFGTSTLAPPTQPNYQAIGLLSTPLDRRRPPQSLLLQSKSPPLQHGGGGGSSSSLRRTSNTLQILVTAASLPKLTEYLRETLKAVISPPAPLSPAAHLSTLQAMTSSLPPPLRPTEKQLMISHNPAIDMLPSPTLRDRLVQAGAGTAQNFLEEVFPGLCGAASAGAGGGGAFQTPYSTARSDGPFKGIIVWGEDPLNETGWEASQEVLDQWSWLMGSEWVRRANFWRAQRNLKPLLDY